MKDNILFNNVESEYGSDYRRHLFEQYKLYVQSIEKISDRRQSANNFFIVINTAIISLVGIFVRLNNHAEISWLEIVVALLGIIVSVIFYYLINSYKQINTGKFKVLHEIETKLPLSLYKYEWIEALKEGKNEAVYYPFSHIEKMIPFVFGSMYFILFIFFLFN